MAKGAHGYDCDAGRDAAMNGIATQKRAFNHVHLLRILMARARRVRIDNHVQPLYNCATQLGRRFSLARSRPHLVDDSCMSLCHCETRQDKTRSRNTLALLMSNAGLHAFWQNPP